MRELVSLNLAILDEYPQSMAHLFHFKYRSYLRKRESVTDPTYS